MTDFLTALPPGVRAKIYYGYAVLGVVFGCTVVGYATAGVSQPGWLKIALAVFAFLGTSTGLVAATNTPKAPDAQALRQVPPDGPLEG